MTSGSLVLTKLLVCVQWCQEESGFGVAGYLSAKISF